jgi:hypothetical protein
LLVASASTSTCGKSNDGLDVLDLEQQGIVAGRRIVENVGVGRRAHVDLLGVGAVLEHLRLAVGDYAVTWSRRLGGGIGEITVADDGPLGKARARLVVIDVLAVFRCSCLCVILGVGGLRSGGGIGVTVGVVRVGWPHAIGLLT